MLEQIEEYKKEYDKIFETLNPSKQAAVAELFQDLKERFAADEEVKLSELQEAILQLKLVRHFQKVDSEDANVLFDALSESPRFLQEDRGSINKLKDIHEQKTLQKIAEIRKQQAESTGQADLNPFEKLVTSASGHYYIARLLNMPHLMEESAYMQHCVGTSNSYINRMKRGEIEILSFRNVQTDMPVITMEYNLKTKTIEQIKEARDGYLSKQDPFFLDFIDALGHLRTTRTLAGDLRDYRAIESGELYYINVPDYHVLTSLGEFSIQDYDPSSNAFIFRTGSMQITPEMSVGDACKIIRILLNIECSPEELALSPEAITSTTKVYAGNLFPGIFAKKLPHIVTLAAHEIKPFSFEVGGKTATELIDAAKEVDAIVREYAVEQLQIFSIQPKPAEVKLVRLSVSDLGFTYRASIWEIYDRAIELGFDLALPEIPFQQSLKKDYHLKDEWYEIVESKILPNHTDRSFYVQRYVQQYDDSMIEGYWSQGIPWNIDIEFIFAMPE